MPAKPVPSVSKSSGFIVKPLNNIHGQAIIDLVLPIQQDEFGVAVTLEDQPDMLNIEAAYIAGGGNFWGAFDRDHLIGTIALLKTGERMAALRKMFVKKAYRGKSTGIAQTLLNTLLNYCCETGITDVYLGTAPQLEAAQRFYEKNGFEQIAVGDLPPAFPRMPPDKIFYFIHPYTKFPAL